MVLQPRVSIITTFYNLEDYVDYCLGTILSQDYEDYEVVCVDDGSSDATFTKLMRYADNPKIRILRQSNGGPSKARNTGIRYAKGHYLSFVDGDDIISPYYLSSLLRPLESGQADISVGNIFFIPENDIESAAKTWQRPKNEEYFTKNRAIELLLCHQFGVSGCGKLAPRELYNERFYPEEHFHEDLRTIVDLLSNVERIALIDEPIYKYIQRPGSNMHGFVSLDKRSADLILAIDHITEVCEEVGINRSYIELYRCLACLRLHNNGGNYIDSRELQKYVRCNLRSALKCKDILLADKLTLRLFAFGIKPYDCIRGIKLKISPNL